MGVEAERASSGEQEMTPNGESWNVDPTRAEFDETTSADVFRELAKRPQLKTLQCSAPVGDAQWRLVNEHICALRPDVKLRVYGHYSRDCDLRFVQLLPNLRHFAADCLRRATGVEALAEIPSLESLSLGVFELTDFSVLERLPPNLTSLSLGATRTKRPSLAPLSRFRSLRRLWIDGHSKHIEALSELLELEDLRLRSVSTPDLQYLSPLPKLRSLDIKLGGIRGFGGIEGKNSIKYLELWQVRDLRRIDIVGSLPGLQNLFLQSLPHVESFPDLSGSSALRRIVVENLKGLHDFTALEKAPMLHDFVLIDGRKQTPEQLLPLLRNPGLRRVRAGFGSKRKNNEFSRLRAEHGKAEFDSWDRFEYQ